MKTGGRGGAPDVDTCNFKPMAIRHCPHILIGPSAVGRVSITPAAIQSSLDALGRKWKA